MGEMGEVGGDGEVGEMGGVGGDGVIRRGRPTCLPKSYAMEKR